MLGIKFPGSSPDLPSQIFVAVPGNAFNSSSEPNAWEPLLQDVWCLKTPNKKHVQSNSNDSISESLFSYLGFWELTVKICALGWKSGKLSSFPVWVQPLVGNVLPLKLQPGKLQGFKEGILLEVLSKSLFRKKRKIKYNLHFYDKMFSWQQPSPFFKWLRSDESESLARETSQTLLA